MSESADFCSRIAATVIELYTKLPRNGKPGFGDEFTVLSAIVAKVGNDSIIIPLSLATGTKCIGANIGNSSGIYLNDSHAEVLARRGFIRYLYSCAIHLLQSCTTEPIDYEWCPLMINPQNGLLSVKDTWTFHLYISDNPCGDSSIYELQYDITCNKEKEISFTGAKLVEAHHSSPAMTIESSEARHREEQQALGALRTKSGRSDIALSDRTTSMSCSDKICRWISLGLQGSLLTAFLSQSIQLSSITVGADPMANEEDQRTALLRALHTRRAISLVNTKHMESSRKMETKSAPKHFDSSSVNTSRAIHEQDMTETKKSSSAYYADLNSIVELYIVPESYTKGQFLQSKSYSKASKLQISSNVNTGTEQTSSDTRKFESTMSLSSTNLSHQANKKAKLHHNSTNSLDSKTFTDDAAVASDTTAELAILQHNTDANSQPLPCIAEDFSNQYKNHPVNSTRKLKPCGFSINWVRSIPPNECDINNSNNDSKIKNEKSTPLNEVSGGTVEVTISHTGLPQGSTLKKLKNNGSLLDTMLTVDMSEYLSKLSHPLATSSHTALIPSSNSIETKQTKNFWSRLSRKELSNLFANTICALVTNPLINQRHIHGLLQSSLQKNSEGNAPYETKKNEEVSINSPLSSHSSHHMPLNKTYTWWKKYVSSKCYKDQEEIFFNDTIFKDWVRNKQK